MPTSLTNRGHTSDGCEGADSTGSHEGTLDGQTGKIVIEANKGDVINILPAPTRKGYTFQYWEGSKTDMNTMARLAYRATCKAQTNRRPLRM